MIRARAGISFALAEAMDDGHCGLPTDELRPLAAELLEIPPEVADAALELELVEGAVVADTVDQRACVFLAGLHRAERDIAERLLRLAKGRPPWPAIAADAALAWVESRTTIALAESQGEAVRLALRSKLLVITGGPGVGKTTLVNSILKILAANPPSPWRRRPAGPPSGWARPPAGRPRRCTGCSRPTRPRAASNGARSTRSTATCWSWTRSRWWT